MRDLSRARRAAKKDRQSLSLSKSARADGLSGSRALRKLDWRQGQARRHHKGQQRSSTAHPGRSTWAYRRPARVGRDKQPKVAAAPRACSGDRMESPNATVRALPLAPAQGKKPPVAAAAIARARGLRLGDQSRGHGISKGLTQSGAVDRSNLEVRST